MKTWVEECYLYKHHCLKKWLENKNKKLPKAISQISPQNFRWALKELFLRYWFLKNQSKFLKFGKLVPQRFVFNKTDIQTRLTDLSLTINQGSNQGTRALINYYVPLTIFINHLTMALRQEPSFLVYQRHLMKFGTRVFSSSWSKMVYQVTF